ncbi:uncharacterized protein LOC143290198 isoform X3 [Babylonia areolata]
MVDEGSLVQNFRFRGFPKQSMERPTVPVTVPWAQDDDDHSNETMQVWVRRPLYNAEHRGEGLAYSERHIDNSPRPRGLRNPPLDVPTDGGWSQREVGEEDPARDRQRLKLERRLELLRELERNQPQPTSPRRDNGQAPRGRNDYRPDNSQYQPSFGVSQRQNSRELQSNHRASGSSRADGHGIPVTDFMKRDSFEDQGSRAQNGVDLQSSHGGTVSSPRMEDRQGVPVTDFIKRDPFEDKVKQGPPSLDPEVRADGSWSPRRQGRGLPDISFLQDSGGSSSEARSRRYRLPEDDTYDPFGRAGGGAPVLDRDGNKKTNVFGNFEKTSDRRELEKDQMAKKMMRQDLRKAMEEQRNRRNQDIQFQRSPETDMAELMGRKEVGRPRVDPYTGTLTSHQHLPSSDVSKVKMNYQSRDERETEEYRRFLQRQIEDRERNRYQDRLRQQHEASEHFAKFDSQWGQQGAGAPRYHGEHRKGRLDNSLYHTPNAHPHYQWGIPFYRNDYYYEQDLRQPAYDVTPRYVKNTIKSTSRNFYENPLDSEQRTNAPFATGYTRG